MTASQADFMKTGRLFGAAGMTVRSGLAPAWAVIWLLVSSACDGTIRDDPGTRTNAARTPTGQEQTDQAGNGSDAPAPIDDLLDPNWNPNGRPDPQVSAPVVGGGGVGVVGYMGDGGTAPSGCPGDLVCVSPDGRYTCQKPGPEALTCEQLTDCPSEIPNCYQRAGQGICLRLCTPPGGFPDKTSIGGKLVEYAPGNGLTGTTQAAKERVLEGVKVCLETPVELKERIGCTTSDADGHFQLDNLPPNIDPTLPIVGTLSFHRDGYLPQAQSFALGDGPQSFASRVRLLTLTYAQALADKVSATLPDDKTGWLLVDTTALDIGGKPGRYTFTQGSLQQVLLANVNITTTPAAGIGPLYTDDDELISALAATDQDRDAGAADDDAGLTNGAPPVATSSSGFAFYVNVPVKENGSLYGLRFKHPDLDCGQAPIAATALPGYLVAGLGTMCGHGVK